MAALRCVCSCVQCCGPGCSLAGRCTTTLLPRGPPPPLLPPPPPPPRPEVAPPEFLRELEKLQDQIPPFCNDEAFAVIQAEYGAPASRLFSAISPEAVAGGQGGLLAGCWGLRGWGCSLHQLHLYLQPTTNPAPPSPPAALVSAAASLGQVYRGVLRSTGEAVAVKVQRPGVATSIALDVYVLRLVRAGLLGRLEAGQTGSWGCRRTEQRLHAPQQSARPTWPGSAAQLSRGRHSPPVFVPTHLQTSAVDPTNPTCLDACLPAAACLCAQVAQVQQRPPRPAG